MFGDFTIPSYLHDSVYWDLIEDGLIPIETNDLDTEIEMIDEDIPF